MTSSPRWLQGERPGSHRPDDSRFLGSGPGALPPRRGAYADAPARRQRELVPAPEIGDVVCNHQRNANCRQAQRRPIDSRVTHGGSPLKSRWERQRLRLMTGITVSTVSSGNRNRRSRAAGSSKPAVARGRTRPVLRGNVRNGMPHTTFMKVNRFSGFRAEAWGGAWPMPQNSFFW
jgi:hypothetical protein